MTENDYNVIGLFANVAPEQLLGNMLPDLFGTGPVVKSSVINTVKDYDALSCLEKRFHINSQVIGEIAYQDALRSVLPCKSEDELRGMHCYYLEKLHSEEAGGIFRLLADRANCLLRLEGEEPVCREEMILRWRMVSHPIGQDLLTCAGYAWNDLKFGHRRTFFSWPACVHTDHVAFEKLLQKGIAENHAHLNGTAQGFGISWAFLMNHPGQIAHYFTDSNFERNLNPFGGSTLILKNLAWKDKILYAAWIRAFLYKKYCLLSIAENDNFKQFVLSGGQVTAVSSIVRSLSFNIGAGFPQKNHTYKKLDYAITPLVYHQNDTVWRLLAGERSFLYSVFSAIFSGRGIRNVNEDMDMLYFYLLIRSRFRSEIIQTNARYGFRNFAEYQNRKDLIWDKYPEYQDEAYQLAVVGDLKDNVKSLELRVTPKIEKKKMVDQIMKPDKASRFRLEEFVQKTDFPIIKPEKAEEQKLKPYFYLIHFVKEPLERISAPTDQLPQLRHKVKRNYVNRVTKTIRSCLHHNKNFAARVRGVDACTFEIGCRPEVFGEAFRIFQADKLHISYHVGEDFLDVADGLRAIEEVFLFCHMRNGDRIGHALALGIAPEDFYRLKGYRLIIPKQDILDNLVWLLFTAPRWGVDIPITLKSRMEKMAEQYLRAIYGSFSIGIQSTKKCWHSPCCIKPCGRYQEALERIDLENTTLEEYYESMRLRGDRPEIYKIFRRDYDEFTAYLEYLYSSSIEYNSHIKTPDRNDEDETEKLDTYREDKIVRVLLYAYHYDKRTRYLGQAQEEWYVDEAYINLVRNMQKAEMNKLMEAGLSIECNPSSNFLIGTFRRYDKHPLFRFYNGNLEIPEKETESHRLSISINTDDQGVFDTSLPYMNMHLCLRH